jgi:hypothetical protein
LVPCSTRDFLQLVLPSLTMLRPYRCGSGHSSFTQWKNPSPLHCISWCYKRCFWLGHLGHTHRTPNYVSDRLHDFTLIFIHATRQLQFVQSPASRLRLFLACIQHQVPSRIFDDSCLSTHHRRPITLDIEHTIVSSSVISPPPQPLPIKRSYTLPFPSAVPIWVLTPNTPPSIPSHRIALPAHLTQVFSTCETPTMPSLIRFVHHSSTYFRVANSNSNFDHYILLHTNTTSSIPSLKLRTAASSLSTTGLVSPPAAQPSALSSLPFALHTSILPSRVYP